MYEYNRSKRGLGWTGSWRLAPPAANQNVQSGVGCGFPQVGHNVICASPAERQFMINQGCVTTAVDGVENCVTGGEIAGELYCCPPGRPGTGQAREPAATYQTPVSRGDIRSLQNYIVEQGCSVGPSGADGIYGPNTAAGLQCAIGRSTHYDVLARFPFVTTLMATPTGQARPESFTFDPGVTAKTPEQVVAGRGGGAQAANTGSTQQDIAIDEQRATMLGGLPWWGWALIAAGGVGVLAFVGLVVLGEDEEGPRSRQRYLADEDADDWGWRG